MSKKKITLTIMSIVIAILVMIIPNIAKASTTLTTSLYFGINEFRDGTTPDKMGYAIFNPYANGATEDSIVGTKIWQIVKYDSEASTNMITGNYYCVRAGVGFNDINKKAEYKIAKMFCRYMGETMDNISIMYNHEFGVVDPTEVLTNATQALALNICEGFNEEVKKQVIRAILTDVDNSVIDSVLKDFESTEDRGSAINENQEVKVVQPTG